MSIRKSALSIIAGVTMGLLMGAGAIYILGGEIDFNKPEDKRIFLWVSSRLNVDPGEMPEVHYKSDKEIESMFALSQANMLLKFIDDSKKRGIGDKEIKAEILTFLKAVMGMYLPEDGIILIRKSMSRCEQKSTLAHEFVHHFQVKYGWKIEEHTPQIIKETYRREMCE